MRYELYKVVFFFILVLTFASCNSDDVLFVSVNGDDANPGTKSKPLATINQAIRFVIEKNIEEPGKQRKIVLREGTFYQKETIVLNSATTGGSAGPLLITNYKDEQVTISGARRLECAWEQYRDGIYKSNIGDINLPDFTQLFVNGKRQIRARFPNGDSKLPDKASFVYPLGADQWPHTKIYYDPETFTDKTWENPDDAILHIFPSHHWGNLQYYISGIDDEDNSISIIQRDPQINETYFHMMSSPGTWIGKNSNYFIENVFEELDVEGEWYFDKTNSDLYYKPYDTTDIHHAVIEVPVLKEIVHIRGTMDAPVDDVEIRNIKFAGTTITFMDQYEYPSLGDWGIVRSGTVFIEGAENISIAGCYFDQVGGNAVFINNYAQGIHVADNIFTECGESAVCLVGKSHLNFDKSYNCKFCGADHPWGWNKPSEEIPSECEISNNIIHDIGVFGKQVAGVFLSISKKNTISHNQIYNTPRAAICFNDGWHGGHLVEYNDVHNTVRETGDHGPFNSWGRERFWCHEQSHGRGVSHPAGDALEDAKYTSVIRNNRFTDNRGWGIDLDDGSSNYHVYNNLCIGVSVKLREGVNRVVENNIFYKGANPPSIHRGYENNHDIFRRNIVVIDSVFYNPTHDIDFVSLSRREKAFHFIGPPEEGKFIEVLDSNIYHTASGSFTARINAGGRSVNLDRVDFGLHEWKKLGFDKNSIFEDPVFMEPKNGDFTLPDDSPAFDIGFEEFDMESFGLTEAFQNLYLPEK